VLNADGTRPPDPPAPPAVASPTGFSRLSVPTARGTFSVSLIKEPLAAVSVRTLSANTTDCARDCPVLPLERYVAESGAFAGMNGTYFCPPDYASCADSRNSYGYALWNSYHGKWINQWALRSPVNGLMTFAPSGARGYRHTYSYVPGTPVTAAISNFPLLVASGAVVDSEAEQSAAQKARSTRGAIGADAQYVYLALVTGASVTEAAFVLQALGARDALNLDGGGSAAMWHGGYTVGPGRLLPNAVVLVRR
jgi:hypothetical protein